MKRVEDRVYPIANGALSMRITRLKIQCIAFFFNSDLMV